jgi:hypothetical protein
MSEEAKKPDDTIIRKDGVKLPQDKKNAESPASEGGSDVV